MICPLDSTPLVTESFKGIDLDACPSCKGIWFGEDELRRLLELDPNALHDLEQFQIPTVSQAKGGPSSLRCPYDDCQLEQFHYLLDSPVVLERCQQCGGFWVRNDELEKMQQVLNSIKRPADRHEIGFAEAMGRHAGFMSRQQYLLGLFTMLRTQSPGWLA